MECNFHPIVWIGDEARGLSWLCESEQDWAPDDPARVIQVVPGNEQVMLRIRIIGKTTALRPRAAAPLHVCLPGHAAEADGKRRLGACALAGCPWYGYDYDLLKNRELLGKPGLDCLKELGVRTLITTNWTPALAYPWPLERAADFKALVKACHAHGIRVIPYLGYQISEKAPEFPP